MSFEIAQDWSVSVNVAGWIIIICLFIVISLTAYQWWKTQLSVKDFILDSSEFGIGNAKLTFKPNRIDQQIAYAIWVELSTRKIGLEIDFEHDVIAEVYNSWYQFFSITRELIKEVPVEKLQSESTREIVKLSVQILNDGVRPHLTRWQARFRNWYEKNLDDDADPQSIQTQYPKYQELKSDLEKINHKLVAYRKSMYLLAVGLNEELSLDNNKGTG